MPTLPFRIREARVALALAAFVLAAPAAHAQSPELAPCDDAPSQRALNRCAGRAFERADSTLNALYRSVLAEAKGQKRRLLRTAERRWVAYKEAHCEAVAHSSRGGSIHPFVVNTCLRRLTEQRIETLRRAYRPQQR